jgi:hypothetical protein
MFLTAREVYETVLQMNRDGSLMTPLNALGVTAQTAHETGNYYHTCGSENFNLGGIKCTRNWLDGRIPWSTRKCLCLKTQEYVGGKYADYKLAFRWYDSLETYLKDHARLISLFYSVSKANVGNPWGYIAGLQGKWATSPYYYQGLTRMTISIAPDLLGFDWRLALKASLYEAVKRGVVPRVMEEYVRERLDK